MNIIFKHKLRYDEADKLIEKYYDGLSTVKEEKMLQQFFLQNSLPEKYKAEKAIFAYLKPTPKTIKFPQFYRYAAAVVILLMGTFSIQTFVAQNKTAYAYVDGKKITDKAQIAAIAKASIREVSTNDEVEEKLQELNNSNLVEQQLGVFSDLENNN